MKIGRLQINWNKKQMQVRPGRVIMNLFGMQVLWNNADTMTIVNDGYVGNPDIYTVVNRITKTASFAPFKVYKIKDQKKTLPV